jgi:PhoPQ-activated pathogenicity-related protein
MTFWRCCTVELDFGIVVLSDVPTQVCDLYQTDWREDDSVAEKLKLMVEQARRKHPVIEVSVWQLDIQVLATLRLIGGFAVKQSALQRLKL